MMNLLSILYIQWLSNCEVVGSVLYQAPLVRTAEEFQTERNSCPVFHPVFDFQLYWLMTKISSYLSSISSRESSLNWQFANVVGSVLHRILEIKWPLLELYIATTIQLLKSHGCIPPSCVDLSQPLLTALWLNNGPLSVHELTMGIFLKISHPYARTITFRIIIFLNRY